MCNKEQIDIVPPKLEELDGSRCFPSVHMQGKLQTRSLCIVAHYLMGLVSCYQQESSGCGDLVLERAKSIANIGRTPRSLWIIGTNNHNP